MLPMSRHPDPVGAYRQAVAENRPPAQIIRAARECPELSLDESMPALLATASPSDNLFERSAERWVQRYRSELEHPPDEREVALIRSALATLPGYDSTAAIGADALEALLELRGMDYARNAVMRFIDRLL
jgi:hypothetical protein